MRKRTGILTIICLIACAGLFLPSVFLVWGCQSQPHAFTETKPKVQVGAEVLIEKKLSLLKGKRIALLSNHTGSVYEQIHVLDTLMQSGVNIVKLFSPEHGFRGEAEAGAYLQSGKDEKTGLNIISLYGNKKKPSGADLADVDLVLFDLQDVGTRFYTYLSTMVYVMEACAESRTALWILDRPNPNGWYVGGPVLEPVNASFVGLHAVPVVHGMTLGEYARMVNEEGWLPGGKKCLLDVIPAQAYTHDMRWEDTGRPWISPSPNLPTVLSALWYPVLCWYEGTPVSIGRGTDSPFEQAGSPWHQAFKRKFLTDSLKEKQIFRVYGNDFLPASFTPRPIPGKSANPLYVSEVCYGVKAISLPQSGDSLWLAGIQLLSSFYKEHTEQKRQGVFFQSFFRRLSGTTKLEQQIQEGVLPEPILNSWKQDIARFRAIRAKYLLY